MYVSGWESGNGETTTVDAFSWSQIEGLHIDLSKCFHSVQIRDSMSSVSVKDKFMMEVRNDGSRRIFAVTQCQGGRRKAEGGGAQKTP
jgi:hypothetical protein